MSQFNHTGELLLKTLMAAQQPTKFEVKLTEEFNFLGEEILYSIKEVAFKYKKAGKEEDTIILGLRGLLREKFPEEFLKEDKKNEAKVKLASLNQEALFASEKGTPLYSEIQIVSEYLEDQDTITEVFYGVISVENGEEIKLGDWFDDSYAGEVRVKIYSDNKEIVEFMPY